MHVMTKEQAEKRGLYVIDRVTGKKVPFTTWHVELTEQQKQEQQKQIDAGKIPF